MKVTRKDFTLSTLSSFNTVLAALPLPSIYVNDGQDGTSATISFLLDIGFLFGMTQEQLLTWLSRILTDDDYNSVQTGILVAIEIALKEILLMYLKSLYTCPIDPLIPDKFLRSVFTEDSPYLGVDRGVMVPLTSIDAFGVLRNNPTTENGSLFYFDVGDDSVSSPNTVYRSTDFNAWLWWVINNDRDNWYNYAWDNRVLYIPKFKDENNGNKNRTWFTDTFAKSQMYYVKDVGLKKAILTARYRETGTSPLNSNVLQVFGASETYKNTGFGGVRNKTVFEFNADYIASLKLFDSKTLATHVVNAVMGLLNASFGTMSLEMNILVKKIEKTVEKVINIPAETSDDSYFEFSEDEYNDIVKDATLRYNGEYDTRNEEGELVKLDTTNVVNAIKRIDSAITADEKQAAIIEALNALGEETEDFSMGINTPFVEKSDIIKKYTTEIVTQIALQLLSPKVMLLFAINDYFLNNTQGTTANIDFNAFMKNFWNILKQCILKISELILQALWDLILGYIRPILALVVKKLVLETLYYYKQLLIDLVTNCVPIIPFNLNRGNFVIDNVNYADIIPTQTEPTT